MGRARPEKSHHPGRATDVPTVGHGTGSGSARTCAPAAARIDRARSPSSMTRPEHRHKPPEPANEKMGMGHNRRLWVALSGRRHGTGRLRPGEPPAGTLTRARTAAPTPAAATASASDRARSEEHTSEPKYI